MAPKTKAKPTLKVTMEDLKAIGGVSSPVDNAQFEEDAQALAPPAAALRDISALILEQLTAEAEVLDAQEKLKAAMERLARVQEKALPDALEAANTSKFETKDGLKVEIKEDIAVSIAKGRRDLCFDWLRKNHLGDLIVMTAQILIGQNEKLRKKLEKQFTKAGYSFKIADDANTATVKAALKRKLEDGSEVPLDIFGGYRYRKAMITLPKGNAKA